MCCLISQKQIEIQKLTPDRWLNFENLFGERGACGGCWCMWWRLSNQEFKQKKGEKNRLAMKSIVDSGRIPGILAYHENKTIGWCSVSPRDEFQRLGTSRILKPIDEMAVWSVMCFFINKDFRNQGVSTVLLRAALNYVRDQGGKIVEGYPVEPKKNRIPDAFAYQGLEKVFRVVGFYEVARRSPTRPIMRFRL